MSAGRSRLVFIGLSLSSSWGNGHATTYRALLRGLHSLGQEVMFLERDTPWYGAHRDLPRPDFCEFGLYADLDDLTARFGEAIRTADAVIIGSYVPDGIAVIDRVAAIAEGVTAFYDIDTPVTLAALEAGTSSYLAARQIPGFDAYLSFTGGPTLGRLRHRYGARRAAAFYCSVDIAQYRPVDIAAEWDLGYLGTYSADRQPALERLLIEPARRCPERRFVVAGPQYPADIVWPANVERIEHLAPREHLAFYGRQRMTLNVTRVDMAAAGWSPSVRLFEAAACGVPLVSDRWEGLGELFPEGRAILVADRAEDVVAALELTHERRSAIARHARDIVLARHSGDVRAVELIDLLQAARERIADALVG